MKYIFAEVEPVDKGIITSVYPAAQVVSKNLQDLDVKILKPAEVICIFIYSVINKQLLATMPNLKLICTRSVGYDHIDVTECEKRGITVCNVPDYGSHVIAEHVFALLLSQFRHITAANTLTKSGNFNYAGLRGIALHQKNLGIIGTGRIGRHVAKIAAGFGMNILAVDQCRTLELEQEYNVQYTTLENALAKSDIISLHLPATPQTKHVINKHSLASMKKGVVIVNTARGTLIDSHALLEALQSGQVAYALLDTVEHEQNFAETQELLNHANVTATPHIGFYADDSVKAMYDVVLSAMQQWEAGTVPATTIKPMHEVCDITPIGV